METNGNYRNMRALDNLLSAISRIRKYCSKH